MSSEKWKSWNRIVEIYIEGKAAITCGKIYSFCVEMSTSNLWIISTFFISAISAYPASMNFNRSDPHLEKSRQFYNIFANQLYPGSVISITLLGDAEQKYGIHAV